MSGFNKEILYNDLTLPPKADIETKEILRKTISAGGGNGALIYLSNSTLFLDTICLQKAKAS